MKDKLSQKEKQFKDVADDFLLDIDTNELWEGIEPALPPKKKRRAGWWLLFGSVMTLVGIVSFWALYEKQSAKPTQKFSQERTASTHLKENKINKNTTAEIALDERTESTKPHASTSKTNERMSSKSMINIDEKVKVVQKKSEQKSPRIFNTFINRPSIESDEKKEIEEDVAILGTTSVDKTAKNFPAEKSTREIGNERENLKMAVLPDLGLDLLQHESLPLDFVMDFTEPVKRIVWKPYWSIYSGVNRNSPSFYTELSEGAAYVAENETAMIGWSGSLNYGQYTINGWRWNAGFAYDRLVNRYRNNNQDIEEMLIDGVVSSVIDRDGNIENTNGQLVQTTITEYDVLWYRNHDLMSVELGAGRQVWNYNAFELWMDGRLGYNIWSRHNGYFFKEGEEFITKFEGGENAPYTSQKIQAGLQLEAMYDLGIISIGALVTYRRGLSPMMESNHFYRIKNSHYGIQLGMVYRP